MPSHWIPVTAIENLPMKEGCSVRRHGLDIALFRLENRVVAVENRCPHQRGPLADGIVSSFEGRITVTCPLHTRRICLETGQTVKPASVDVPCVRTFPAKVEGGLVFIELHTRTETEAA